MLKRKEDYKNLFLKLSTEFSLKFAESILSKTGRGGESATRDYIRANCLLVEVLKVTTVEQRLAIDTHEEALKLLHPTTRYRLASYSPCLSARYDELKLAAQNELFDSNKYIFTEKENGVRGWIIHHSGVTKLYSRNYSDKDCGLLDYWGNIHQEVKSDMSFVMDVEVKYEADSTVYEYLEELGIATTSKLEAMSSLLQMNQPQALEIQKKYKARTGKELVVFRLIHPLNYGGVNYKNKPLGDGIDDYDEVIKGVRALGVNLAEIRRCNGSRIEKETFLQSILLEGGEGVVAHNRASKYNTSDNRSKETYIKIKRSVSSEMKKADGLGDTIDGFVTGFKLGSPGTANEGLVSALEVSVYLESNGEKKQVIIAMVPNIALEQKKVITIPGDDGQPTLDPEFYGTVVEVDGQAISKVEKRLTHPRLIRYRYDKFQSDCVYSSDFIESQIV